MSDLLLETADLLRRLALVGLGAGAVTQVAKFAVRAGLLAARRWPAEGTPARSLWREGVRAFAVVVGGALGCAPLWPDQIPMIGGVLLGLVAGTSSPALYDAWYRMIDGAPAALQRAVDARLGLGSDHGRATEPIPPAPPAPVPELDVEAALAAREEEP